MRTQSRFWKAVYLGFKSGVDSINVIGKGVNEKSFVFLECSLPRVACSQERGPESPNQSVIDSDLVSLVNLFFNKEEIARCGSVETGKKWVSDKEAPRSL